MKFSILIKRVTVVLGLFLAFVLLLYSFMHAGNTEYGKATYDLVLSFYAFWGATKVADTL